MPISLSGSLLITGSLTTSGTLTAQTLVVQTVTSSIVYSSGSNIFGNQLTNVQQMTGSLRVTGSGNHYIQGGNVGIGTSSPARLLSLYATTPVLQFINPTTGITSNDGTQLYQNAENFSLELQDSGYFNISTGGSERMRITASGSVGIGVTPGAAVAGIVELAVGGSASNPLINGIRDGVNAFYIYSDSGGTDFGEKRNLYTRFITNNLERMRITSGGNVGIGINNPTEILHLYTSAGPELRMEGGAFSWYIRSYNDNFNVLTPTGRQAVSFLNNGDVRNYSNTTTWQQTSDARVKENINTISDAMDKILSLNPVIFDYKQEFADKNNWDDNKKINNVGFIAQEFETIFPKYISTNKYEMTETIIDDLKSIDTGHLVTYLVKAVQELKAENDTLKEILQRNNIQ